MHTTACRAAIAAALAFSGLQAHAVVAAGHWQLAHEPADLTGANLVVNIDQTPNGDDTATILDYDTRAGTLRFITLALDEGSELFLVKPGDLLANPTAGTLLPSLLHADALSVQVGPDFYLGAGTRSASDPGVNGGTGNWSSFGWAHFQVDTRGRLGIVDSAMGFREDGIVVGTLQAIPEPSAWLMAGTGLAGIGLLRRTRHPNKG